MSGNSKLHPIYVAMDSHQWSKAIKLCLALPKEDVLAQALLAHAYNKSLQRHKSLVTLQSILGTEGFQELQLECRYSMENWVEQNATGNTPHPPPPQPAAAKKGKKSKKKPAAAPSLKPEVVPDKAYQKFSLVACMDEPPTIDYEWETLPPSEMAIIDETTLATLVPTLHNLRLYLTCYQMYCWAASKMESSTLLRKAFLYGIGVLVAPQYDYIAQKILANMQVLALQFARMAQQEGMPSTSNLATSWVAQTALWQLKLADDPSRTGGDDEAKQKQRLALLPRLAETLAAKCIDGASDAGTSALEFSVRRELYYLYLRTLRYQSKWEEMLTILQSDVFKASGDSVVTLAPKQQILELQAECLENLQNFQEARLRYEELLEGIPDDFRYWKGYLRCSLAEHGNEESGLKATNDLVGRVMEQQKSEPYPKRGPHLMKLELVAEMIRRDQAKCATVANALVAEIKEYGNAFAPRVSCAFTDMETYLELMTECGNDDLIVALLKWLQSLRVFPDATDPKEERLQQRSFIFSVKVTHKLLAQRSDLQQDWMPDWKDLVRVWKKTLSCDPPIQKESLPGDDLIILAIQQLMSSEPCTDKLFVATVLVEAGIENSPNNATLKICAMDLYSRLNAAARSWELYQGLHIKHIQLDTCSFLILPILQAGGLYRETLKICKGLMALHATVVRDTCDFSGRAMENGIISKGDEFIFFQRQKMATSLTAFEAKGLVLDFAAFYDMDEYATQLGAAIGIVGGEEDFERAAEAALATRNLASGPSLLRAISETTSPDQFSDNRDLSTLDFEKLAKRRIASAEEIVNASIQRAHNHSLLLRAAFCVQFTKSPKKGKIVKPGEELVESSKSLLVCMDSASDFCSNIENTGEKDATKALIELCRALAVVSAGAGLEACVNDSLEAREKQSIQHIQAAALLIEQTIHEITFQEGTSPVPFICSFLPTCIVPLFALFRMLAEMLEVFGWGKRKQKSKQIAAEFAKLAAAFANLMKQAKVHVTREAVVGEAALLGDLRDAIDEKLIDETRSRVVSCRQLAKQRVIAVCDEVLGCLDTFDCNDDQ